MYSIDTTVVGIFARRFVYLAIGYLSIYLHETGCSG